jgi:hypothetical protein
MDQNNQKRLEKFRLKKETVRELDLDELALARGGQETTLIHTGTGNSATASCCVGCNTDGSNTNCKRQGDGC